MLCFQSGGHGLETFDFSAETFREDTQLPDRSVGMVLDGLNVFRFDGGVSELDAEIQRPFRVHAEKLPHVVGNGKLGIGFTFVVNYGFGFFSLFLIVSDGRSATNFSRNISGDYINFCIVFLYSGCCSFRPVSILPLGQAIVGQILFATKFGHIQTGVSVLRQNSIKLAGVAVGAKVFSCQFLQIHQQAADGILVGGFSAHAAVHLCKFNVVHFLFFWLVFSVLVSVSPTPVLPAFVSQQVP